MGKGSLNKAASLPLSSPPPVLRTPWDRRGGVELCGEWRGKETNSGGEYTCSGVKGRRAEGEAVKRQRGQIPQQNRQLLCGIDRQCRGVNVWIDERTWHASSRGDPRSESREQ